MKMYIKNPYNQYNCECVDVDYFMSHYKITSVPEEYEHALKMANSKSKEFSHYHHIDTYLKDDNNWRVQIKHQIIWEDLCKSKRIFCDAIKTLDKSALLELGQTGMYTELITFEIPFR